MNPRFLIAALSLTCAGFVRAEDWTAADGTTYKDVKVLAHDDGYVTILDSDGGGKIPLRLLNADLQKRFNYDAVKAAACEAATTAKDRADRQALVQEEAAEQAARQQQLIQQQQQAAAAVPPSSGVPAAAPSAASVPAAAPAPSQPTLDAEQRQQIQQQIADLQADVAFMTEQEAKLYNRHGDSGTLMTSDGEAHEYVGGAYAQKIKDENQQISDLQAQLRASQ